MIVCVNLVMNNKKRLEMIEKIASKQKPIVLATGDATLSEIDEAIRTIESTGNNNLILLQCITNYPSMIESANINVLKTYQNAFDFARRCVKSRAIGLGVLLAAVNEIQLEAPDGGHNSEQVEEHRWAEPEQGAQMEIWVGRRY